MKYIHSIWSTPSIKDNFDNDYDIKYLNKNFYTYLMSVILIKKLGYVIELYCDKHAYNLYSMIPYDKIHIVDFDSDGVSSKFWIWGKIKTHILMTEPYIHIDGDVLLFRDIIGDNITSGRYKVAVQSLENDKTIGNHFHDIYSRSKNPFDKMNNHGIDWNKYNLAAYNCGVVGFSDMKLKNIYANKVKEILVDISTNGDFKSNRKKYEGMFLIAEQSLLHYILKENNVEPFEIIPIKEIEKRNYNWFQIADEIGYAHLWSYTKYKDIVIEKIKFKINKFFPQYSHIIKEFESEYLNKI